MTLHAPGRPCAECPWRTDVETGVFPVERFRQMAHTAADMDQGLFQCHRTSEGAPLICAGFLERGADHNLTVRLAYMNGRLERTDRSGGLPLYRDYREMAVANGVDPRNEELEQCRSRSQ